MCLSEVPEAPVYHSHFLLGLRAQEPLDIDFQSVSDRDEQLLLVGVDQPIVVADRLPLQVENLSVNPSEPRAREVVRGVGETGHRVGLDEAFLHALEVVQVEFVGRWVVLWHTEAVDAGKRTGLGGG